MGKERLLRICKIVHRITLVIGLLTIVLPLIFWSKIPETIPIHYGALGHADNYGDKNSLILLLFVVVMLIGVMNIAIYYVKSSVASKYAKETEKSMMNQVYPVIVFMNLSIQVIFAYIMFCCATGRNLGSWFMIISLVATFTPIVFLVVKKPREKKEIPSLVKGEGIVYRSKVDWWLVLILLGTVGVMVWGTIEPLVKGKGIDWTMTITTVLVLGLLTSLTAIKYVLYPEYLYICCGFLGKTKIHYGEIRNMKETHNPLSSAAMSLDRIQIDYMENGVHRMVLISPVRKKEFMEKVEEYRDKKRQDT